jgi:replicative DNA helicase
MLQVSAEDIFTDFLRQLFRAAVSLHEEHESINQISISTRAKISKDERAIVSRLIANCPTTVHADYYAKEVAEWAVRRRLIQACGHIAKQAYDTNLSLDDLYARAAAMLEVGRAKGLESGFKNMGELILEALPRLNEWIEGGMKSLGRSTQLPSLDKVINGLERAKLYLLAGRPSMGKTQVAITLSRAVMGSGLPVAFFSADADAHSLVLRLGSMVSGKRLIEDSDTFMEGLSSLSNWPLWVRDRRAEDMGAMRLHLKRVESQIGRVGLVVYDYLELAGERKQYRENEEQRLSDLVKGFKDLAREFDCPMLLLTQLNREVERRPAPHIPRLSDIRYTGMGEQEADVAMFLHRPEFYWGQWQDEGNGRHVKDEDKDALHVYILKNKDGATGKVSLFYDAAKGVIRDK